MHPTVRLVPRDYMNVDVICGNHFCLFSARTLDKEYSLLFVVRKDKGRD